MLTRRPFPWIVPRLAFSISSVLVTGGLDNQKGCNSTVPSS